MKAFQPPVEILPRLDAGSKSLMLGFLYPKDFTGHKYNQTTPIESSSLHVEITESSKPIPVVYPSDLNLKSGRIYSIKAKVVELPQEHLLQLTRHLHGFSDSVYSNSVRLLSLHNKSLCLLVGEDGLRAKESNTSNWLDTMPGSFFVEAHLPFYENIDMYQLISSAMPYVDNRILIMQNIDLSPTRTFYNTGNVKVIYRFPSIIGFYIDTDLVNKTIYKERLLELKDFLLKFDRNIQTLSQKQFGKRLKMYVDFISDVRLIGEFGLPRVLSSHEIDEVITKYEELRPALNWAMGL